MESYHALTEAMTYYHMEFYVFLVTLVIMVLQTAKAALHASGRYHAGKTYYLDIAAGLLILSANVSGLIFQGALLDISQNLTNTWLTRLLVISVLNALLFLAQIILWKRKSPSAQA